jgi:hypothetical protein
MRKLMVLPMAGLLALGVVGPVAAAPNVSNTSGTTEAIYGEWSGGGGYGYVFLGEESGYGGYGDIYQESGEWVECTPADGPAPDGPKILDTGGPEGESYGFVGTRTWGYAEDLRIDFSKKFDSGRATGSFELYTETVNECEGVYGDAITETGALDITVTGVGSIVTFRGSGSYKVPSEFNAHSSQRGKERPATGAVVVGTVIDATFTYGYMSQSSWTDHSNS